MKLKRKDSERYGCDYCKSRNCSTEKFEGYCGNVLWICHQCFLKLIKKPKSEDKRR